MSLEAMKKLKIYNEQSARDPSAASIGSTGGASKSYYALRGGSQDGVFKSLQAVIAAQRKGRGEYDVFQSEADAAEFCKPCDIGKKATADVQSYVVWRGKDTGVMSAERVETHRE